MRLLTVLLFLLLAGCATPEQIAERQRQEALQREQAAANYWRRLNAHCSQIGYQPNTDGFRNCVLQLHQSEQQQRAAIGAAIIGSGMLKPPPAPRRTNCYTDTFGYTRCTTY